MAVYDYIHDQEEQESYEKMSALFVEEEVFILFEFREKISSLRSIVFRVWCSEFGVQSLVFRVWCSKWMVVPGCVPWVAAVRRQRTSRWLQRLWSM
jgi:hypothetical protein